MSADSVRAYVAEELDLPAEWVVIPAQRFPETVGKPTVVIQHSRIEKLPEAPRGHLRHEVVLSVLIPNQDLDSAEDALDAVVSEILTALDGHQFINWSGAEKVLHAQKYPAWNITLSVITTAPVPDPEPEPTEE